MQNLLRSLKNLIFSKGSKALLSLVAGTGLAQAFPFLVSPILTRSFSPENFAVLEIVLRVLSILIPIFSLRLEQAIVLPKNNSEAIKISGAAIFSSFMFTLFFVIFFFLFNKPIASLLNNKEVSVWLIPLPFLVFFSIVIQVSGNYYVRNLQFKSFGISKVFDSGINNIVKVLFSLGFPFTNSGLIIPNFIAAISIGFYTAKHAFNQNFMVLLKEISFSNFIKQVKNFPDFPKINLPNALLDNLLLSVFIFILSRQYGNVSLGLYALTLRVLKTPLSVIGNSTGQVFMQKAANLRAQNLSVNRIFLKSFFLLFCIGLLIFIPIFFYGVPLFKFFFGDTWEASGKLAEITGIWLFLSFLASGLSSLPVILRKQKTVFTFAVLNFFILNATLFICAKVGTVFFDAFYYISIVESIYFGVVLLWYFKIAKNSIN